SPFEGSFESDLTNPICPRRDADWWHVHTSGPNKIILADADYQKFSNMRLALDWIVPKGACVDAPTVTCTAPIDCGGAGRTCDSFRHVCRDNLEVPCWLGNGCGAGTACQVAVVTLSSAIEPAGSGTAHRIQGSFLAIENADYYVKVADQAEVEADA